MIHTKANKLVFIFLLCSTLSIGYASAQEEYSDDFKTFDSSSWTVLTSDTWQIVNGTISSTSSRTGLIFNKIEDEKYIIEVDFSANPTRIPDFAQIGFYFYYEDSDNYGRVLFSDDNRKDKKDTVIIEQKGPTFTNTRTFISISTNTSIEFNPNTFHHLKLVRLNKNIYVYFDNRLALTTEFKDENPSGKTGFNIYECTGYFDNFYLRPITMENASDYINELNLNATTPSTRIGSIYTLSLDGVANNDALFSLSKFGKTIDYTVASEGKIVSMNYENGEEGLNFKVTRIFDAQGNSAVWLEDIISASTDELNLIVDEISLDPTYHQEQDMDISFSIKNNFGVRYTGTPQITINTDGSSTILTPEMDLASGQSESFNTVLKAPKKPGSYTVTVSVKSEYSTIKEAVDYRVLALNPAVTALTADLREDDGIRGTVNLESPFSPDLVDWDMTAAVKVYAIYENGKSQVLFKEVPVTGSTFDIGLSYDDFYQGDGQYLVVVEAGGMLSMAV